MTLGALGFLSPLLLAGLLALPLIWWLLRATPPEPRRFYFPAIRLLKGLQSGQTTPDRSPWWLTLLRMIAAALVIFALAEPVLNPDRATLAGSGPVVLVVDNSWAAADSWERRVETLSTLIGNADRAGRQVAPRELEACVLDRPDLGRGGGEAVEAGHGAGGGAPAIGG